jgi:hypothetical protein
MTEPPLESPPRDARPARHGPGGYAVLAWLLATAGRFAYAAGTGFSDAQIPWWSKIATAAVALLAAAAAPPFLRFRRSGWEMAMWVLVTALVMDVARIVLGTRQWIPAALAAGATAFCLGWLWRTRTAFVEADDWDATEEMKRPLSPTLSADHAHADPVADALGAIHRRIVDAGSACAAPREALLAEAARYGVRGETLRREGLSLYRTFLQHFRADGPLSVEEERELFCLEGVLELDPIAVARLRSELGAADRTPPAEPVRPAPEPEPAPVEAVTPGEDADRTVAAIPAADADRTLPAQLVEAEAPEQSIFATHTPGLAGMAAGSALADYEQHELDALTGWAGIALPPDADPRAALESLRTFHRIATEPLETVEPGLALEHDERCYAVRTVELYRMPAGAPADAAPQASGLDPLAFVDGSLERDCDLSRYQRAGACRFLVTDRRLLLVAPSGQQSPLPLERIRGVHPHGNGIEVRPLRGSPVFLAVRDGVADVAMRLGRALHDRAAARPA